MPTKKINLLLINLIIFISISSCGIYKKVDTRETPINAQERARKAVDEGKGLGIKNIIGGRNNNFEFSSSNPMWRASLEVLDFLPLTNVDYSGGVIISDWYSISNSENDSLKISLRFLSNEIRTDTIKITVFKKNCKSIDNCTVSKTVSKIEEELIKSILTKASELEKENKKN